MIQTKEGKSPYRPTYYRGLEYKCALSAPDPFDSPTAPIDPEDPERPIAVRKNQADMTPDEKQRFKDVINELIASGFYNAHVAHHSNMTHRMHGSMSGSLVAFRRFLPWHRVYLDRLEEAMREVDPEAFLPYWKWSADRDLPDWIAGFTPEGVTINGSPLVITRDTGGDPDAPNLPTEADVTTIMQLADYTQFTTRLEGVPFGAHNQVHVWVGGTMSSVPFAPADPLFWMHHAECDRLWHVWQQDHPNETPPLTGVNAVLDPWPETSDAVLDIATIGYSYA